MLYIKNANVVLENGILWDGAIVVGDDRIVAVGKEAALPVPAGAEVVDAEGLYVGPGFVDIHVHGGGGYSTALQPLEAAAYFLENGTTSLLSSPSYSSPFAEFLQMIRTVNACRDTCEIAKVIKGFYMEGPYMNPKYGAYAHLNPWRAPISEAQYKVLVDEAGDFARVWAIAPEREGLAPFMDYARKVNPNVRFAVGHCEATPDQIRALSHYGLNLQTHSQNATGRLPVPLGTRSSGPDEYFMMTPDTYTELICDSCAIHVSADRQRFLLHCKGVDKVILITDCTNHANPNPPELSHVTDLNFDDRGGLSGSRLTMNAACRNIMTHTNCGIAQAFLMASRNPARAIGIDDEVGTVEVGKKANLVFVDDVFHVQKVMLAGSFV